MAKTKKPTKTRLIKVIQDRVDEKIQATKAIVDHQIQIIDKRQEAVKNPSKIFRYKADNGQEYGLNLRQKLFCELYLELEGNGTQAAIEAGYNVTNVRGETNRNLAKSIATENLSKPAIFGFINVLLTREGFNSENVDKQHLFLVNQHSDLSAKAKGIDMFNKLRGRYPKDQAITDALTKYQSMPDSELKEIIDGEIVKEDE